MLKDGAALGVPQGSRQGTGTTERLARPVPARCPRGGLDHKAQSRFGTLGRRSGPLLAFLLMVGSIGCGQGIPEPPDPRRVPLLLTPDPLFPTGVREISLERHGCYGICPIYRVILHKGDQARYLGTAHVDRKGSYTGSVFFTPVALWMRSQPTLMDKSESLPVITDGETVTLTITFDDGREIVKEFGTGSEREDLWVAAEVIDGVSSKIRWEVSEQ